MSLASETIRHQGSRAPARLVAGLLGGLLVAGFALPFVAFLWRAGSVTLW